MATPNLNSQTKITVNNFPDSVRENPDVYIQGTSAALSCFREILDNSVDEHKAGFCDTINVAIDKNDNIMVQDNGRGIPIAPCDDVLHKDKSQLEVAMTVLSAGGKFLNDEAAGYKEDTAGKNGMGLSVCNALSSMMVAEVQANGHLYQVKFEKGIFTQRQKIVKDIDPKLHGTIVRYHLDPEMFEDITVDRDKLLEMCQQKALLNNGLKINVAIQYEDGRVIKETYCYEDGMSTYLNMLLANKTMAIDTRIHLSKTVPAKELPRDLSFDVAFGYVDSYSQEFVSFVNSIPTEDGGSHVQGLSQGICDAVRRYALEKKKIKNKTDLQGDDCSRGAVGIIAIRYKKPSFDRQSKTKLDMPKVKTIIAHALEDAFYDFLEKTPKEAEVILEKALQARKERIEMKKARERVRNDKSAGSTALPDKFADCTSNDPSQCEVFLVEGDSAAGSAKKGRDKAKQAILSVFGKIYNAEKEILSKLLSSPKCVDIGRALRTGFGPSFDITKLRYNKIIIMTDADVDGAHIRSLLLTFLYRLCPGLIEGGYVYAACPPLYKVYKGKGKSEEIHYFYSDKEKETFLEDKEGYLVQRYKGLGEMDAEQLWETTMNPETRILKKITIENVELAEEMISAWMGKDSSARKERIFDELGEEASAA